MTLWTAVALASVVCVALKALGYLIPPRWFDAPAPSRIIDLLTVALLAVAGTLATILLANWGIAAMEIGRSMGLLPWESALRLGSSYAWELIRLANNAIELAWYALAVFVAAVGGISGRRPAP